ncbi:hypothetical protein [Candidatus Cryosericum septentrionale]|uniref:hypothetical protein n=1 Tax=Candidatus Cryosericum septentrionale TaxID=2290913 RepID=UPI0039B8236A
MASGPTYFDSPTFNDAYSVLEEYKLLDSVPKFYVKCHRKGLRGEVMETLKKEKHCRVIFTIYLLQPIMKPVPKWNYSSKVRVIIHNTPYLGASVQGDVLAQKPLRRFTGFAENTRGRPRCGLPPMTLRRR